VNFAREGMPYIGISIGAAAIALMIALIARSWPFWFLSGAIVLVALWVAYFFRDPERVGPRGERLVIAPADGRVVMVTTVDEPSFLQGRATRISIFMNIFDVHVNRYPVSGAVTFVKHTPGRFLDAQAERASVENEQNSVGVVDAGQRVMVRQIAGLIARRIVTYAQLGDRARQGERMGLIRFGSRVDVFFPEGASIRVKPGDRAVAGVSVLAELP
jgi:phosphatidylserine decarboxylase